MLIGCQAALDGDAPVGDVLRSKARSRATLSDRCLLAGITRNQRCGRHRCRVEPRRSTALVTASSTLSGVRERALALACMGASVRVREEALGLAWLGLAWLGLAWLALEVF